MPTPKLEDRNVARRRTTWRLGKLLLGLIALLLAGFFWQLFGPNPPITVSRETTYITEPLGEDGLPDYRRYVLEKMRKGITPEENGAVLFWRACGLDEFRPEDAVLLSEELHLEPLLPKEKQLQSVIGKHVTGRVEAWLADQRPELADTEGDSLVTPVFELADAMMTAAESTPWTANQLPPIAAWLDERSEALDLLIAAVDLPEWYTPSPVLLSDKDEGLIGLSRPNYSNASWCLELRSNLRLGKGDLVGAWRNCRASLLLDRRACADCSPLELMSIAIGAFRTCRIAASLLNHPNVTVDLVAEIADEFGAEQDSQGKWKSAIDNERLVILDYTIRQANPQTRDSFVVESLDPTTRWFATQTRIEYDSALIAVNWQSSALDNAFASSDRRARLVALSRRQQSELGSSESLDEVWEAILFAACRGRIMGEKIFDMWGSAKDAELIVATSVTEQQLVCLAAQLVAHRIDTGNYPEALTALKRAPGVDSLSGLPFRYRRTDEGFLLYSVGANGIDDGGSRSIANPEDAMFEGFPLEYWIESEPIPPIAKEELEGWEGDEDFDLEPSWEDHPRYQQISPGADDISLRFPVWHKPWPVLNRPEGE
ncbi:hypothetical protein Pla175_40660 [Pirellulimonas nuda]|uniref:Bacterial type II secretion system protein G n=1 Tax=Pirellulimonas nuda TaxID=2528009 RepID=A0A518DGQ6_9BACT|nr:hypothetical protein [Pirellulimonas nuda]QDU90657.1 hypothetical protein Pla175_40660 [Pirellulimonas nuda]